MANKHNKRKHDGQKHQKAKKARMETLYPKVVEEFQRNLAQKLYNNDEDLKDAVQKEIKNARTKFGTLAPACFIMTTKHLVCCKSSCKQVVVNHNHQVEQAYTAIKNHRRDHHPKSSFDRNQLIVLRLKQTQAEVLDFENFEKALPEAEKEAQKDPLSNTKIEGFLKTMHKKGLKTTSDELVTCTAENFETEFAKAGGSKNWTKAFVIEGSKNLAGAVHPNQKMTILDILSKFPPKTKVKLDSVHENTDKIVTMTEAIKLFKQKQGRTHIYNILNLDFTKIKDVRSIMKSPDCVRNLALEEKLKTEFLQSRHTLLVTMGGAFTDWHFDYSGIAVDFHMIKGTKHMYLLPPTKKNMKDFKKYWKTDGVDGWFGNRNGIIKVILNAGDTLLMPPGWLHAVHTPRDAMAFSGGFFSESILQQLKIRELELEVDKTRSLKEMMIEKPIFNKIYYNILEKYLLKNVEEHIKSHPQNPLPASTKENFEKAIKFFKPIFIKGSQKQLMDRCINQMKSPDYK